MRGIRVNIEGNTYGYWRVGAFVALDKRKNTKFRCTCGICGKEYDVLSNNLISGHSRKCANCGRKYKNKE